MENANAIAVSSPLFSAQITEARLNGRTSNYTLTMPSGTEVILKRDEDFGKYGKAKKPSLLKPGAEKIAMMYGMLQRFSIKSMTEDVQGDSAFFSYTVECQLVKIGNNGQEYVFSSAYGSANTREKRNGFSSPFDSQNSTLKMAQKRALVAAALAISGLSSMFTQDIEDDTVAEKYNEMVDAAKANRPTSNQIRRLYAIGSNVGLSGDKVKQELLAKFGVAKVSDLTLDLYDKVCEYFEHYGEDTADGNA